MKDVVCVWQTNAKLGEGPLWVAAENSIYWLDILNKHVHRLNLGSGERQTWTFPFAITSLAIRQSGGFVGTTVDGFAIIDFDSACTNVKAKLWEFGEQLLRSYA